MNAEIFAEWYRRRGLKVVRTASSFWVNLGKRVYQAFPYHWLIQPQQPELDELFYGHKALGLRYSTHFTASAGCLSYHTVHEQSSYELSQLGGKARYDVRRGLQNCQVSRISMPQLAGAGWRLLTDTWERQGRQRVFPLATWQLLCKAAEDLPGFAAWGALVGQELGAAALTFQMEDYGYILYQQSHRQYLPAKVNNALCFELTRNLKKIPGVSFIHYGLHSPDAPESVDKFKFRMGYAAKPVRQRVVFHPLLQALVNRASHTVVRKFLRVAPGNPTLAKAEGMMRFYLEGRRPLKDQRPPAAIFPDRGPQRTAPLDGVVPGKD
jgi:hypothetical protein